MHVFDFAPSFKEWTVSREKPLASIFRALFVELQGRTDVVVFGSQAVNAYVRPPRATEDLDLQSTHAAVLAEDLKTFLHRRFHLATRVREVKTGAFRVYEKDGRHLIDVRQVDTLPPFCAMEGLQVMEPVPLLAGKFKASVERAARPKGGTDLTDLRRLAQTFPKLKVRGGAVEKELRRMNLSPAILVAWGVFVDTPIEADDDADC